MKTIKALLLILIGLAILIFIPAISLLFRPVAETELDMNNDKIVDITDFSIADGKASQILEVLKNQ